jgi:hypothetical protein
MTAVTAHAEDADAPADSAKPRTYALVAAVGNQYSLVTEVETVGSHLSPYRKLTVDVPGNLLNRFVLHSMDAAIARMEPASTRLYLTIATPPMDRVPPGKRGQLAIDSVVAALEGMPERATWDRIVVVTPAYQALKHDRMANRLQGLGVFAQPLCQGTPTSCAMGFEATGPDAVTPEGKSVRANYFVAPFSYIEVWIVDPKTLAIVERQAQFDNRKLYDPKSPSATITGNATSASLAAGFGRVIEKSVQSAVAETGLVQGQSEVGEIHRIKPQDGVKTP